MTIKFLNTRALRANQSNQGQAFGRSSIRPTSRLIVLLIGACGVASAATPTQGDSPDYGRCAPNGVAIGGYDLVSYRTEDGPVLGVAGITATHDGLVYRFASVDNKQAFVKDPAAFLPRYHGWCATTLAMGRLTCPDFTNFKLEDGELLLFELAGFTNGRSMWNSDPQAFRQRADTNAKALLAETGSGKTLPSP